MITIGHLLARVFSSIDIFLLLLNLKSIFSIRRPCGPVMAYCSKFTVFTAQELIKERLLPERAWIFFHVVTRR